MEARRGIKLVERGRGLAVVILSTNRVMRTIFINIPVTVCLLSKQIKELPRREPCVSLIWHRFRREICSLRIPGRLSAWGKSISLRSLET